MSYSGNTSQFVKTYGKPRRTQRLGQESLWHEDLADDFDKCLGVEEVQQTTFISPEPASSVTMYKSAKHSKKIENKIKTIGGWSMQLHTTLNGHKANSTVKKKNIQYNFNQKNMLLQSTKRKFNDSDNFSKIYSSSLKLNTNYSDIGRQSKAISTSVKKPKNKFILTKEQCSTPLKKPVSFVCGSKLKNVSSKKKKKKTKLKRNLAYAFDNSNAVEMFNKPNHSYLNSSNSLEINDKLSLNNQSVLISGSHFSNILKKEPSIKNNCLQNTCMNNSKTETYLRPILKKYCKSINKKKETSKEKNSNWYKKVMDVFCDEEFNSFEDSFNKKYKNEEIISEESLRNHFSISDTTCIETINGITTSLKQQKQQICSDLINKSFNSVKYTIKSSSEKDHDIKSDFTKSNKNISIKTENTNIITNEKPELYVQFDTSKSYNNPLNLSCYQLDQNKLNEKSAFLNNVCVINNNESNKLVERSLNIDVNLSQINQFEKSLCKNSSYMIQIKNKVQSNSTCNSNLDYSKESCVDSLDLKLLNVLERVQMNNDNVISNQISCLSNENNKSNNYISNTSNSLVLVNVTNKFSDITIDDKVLQHDQSLHLSLKHDTSHNSCSTTQSLSSLEQDTVIVKQNNTNICLKENADPNYLFLNENNSISLETNCKYSPKKEYLHCNNIIYNKNKNISYNRQNVPDHTLIKSCNYYQRISDTIYCSDILQCNNNVKSELLQPETSYSIKHEEFQHDHDQSKNTSINFENISAIVYEEKPLIENENNFSYSTFFDKSKLNSFNVSQNISRRKRYAGRFQNNLNIIEENKIDIQNSTQNYFDYTQSELFQQNTSGFHLEPGKKWRRSLVIVRNFIDGNLDQTTNCTQQTSKGRKWISTVDDVLRQVLNTSIHQSLDQKSIFRNSISPCSQKYLQRNSIENDSARKYILDLCNQRQIIPFESWIEPKNKKKWNKIGEGVYGEVFSYNVLKSNVVVKIIPVEGENNINGEQQKLMSEVYSEILIATELNKLLDKNNWNQTKSFCKIKNISCVQGIYPAKLIKLWEQYDIDKGSDNDNPSILPENQIFMILEMEDGGIDVEHFVFNSAYQSLFAFIQIVFGLAVAEQQYDFEHRDLHIGNILVKKITNSKKISYTLNGEIYTVPSQGVKITIIDFTLSRMTNYNKPVYNNLAEDIDLFTSFGDYQFQIYRMMKMETKNQWNLYKPKTNVYWLHYVLDKMLESVHYKKTFTIIHNTGLKYLQKMKNSILLFDSAKSFAESSIVNDILEL